MNFLGFKSCLADPDVWSRAATRADGTEYYEYVLLYVDDALVFSDNAESILRKEIGKYFELKEEYQLDHRKDTSGVSFAKSQCQMAKGYLAQLLFHIFGYLQKHHDAEMPFDPPEPEIDEAQFERRDWSQSIYGDVEEETPSNKSKPLGRSMSMRVYVDADHAGESITRRSRTGFLVFLNVAHIYWLSKKQTSCETSTFGSEFVAMKQATEYVRGLRYKLRMLGIHCKEPAFVYGDNQSVLANTTVPESQHKKKSNSIAYTIL
ncbi:hypothetical protein ACHAXR_003841 [Thalassiosira sp. AJA248-18]